ncbi:hypothetical protein TCAL_06273 [Tigriopus californicus]|uniref:SRP54-type proteins GTP-binding domain-containing protein n=1 Tax=Tigriopus californicus TaxID=6832 RepID=A0A553NF75_TIGCA|nr:hypothetical protein TCAL_06273 [Tigriopus californicus]|eukprot:TCALIF_06273-PA protein Name:"Similar to Srpr Signal recognition particle receptor subunit alpha (Mus musculus)" AED:0.21 eAED:0.21 QI:72/1/0.85/1/1/1/7/0/561
MLDFFSVFSRGGILLWCFKGAEDIFASDWAQFRPAVNAFIKTVLLQEMASKNCTYESGSLALKYKLDNEFDLVFIAGYQKMLPLYYLDKLLDEIQLRFRDKYLNVLKESNFFHSFDFSAEFQRTLKLVENDAKHSENRRKTEMRTFEDSSKSKKSIASMIEKKDGPGRGSHKRGEDQEATANGLNSSSVDDNKNELDEETRMANLSALQKKLVKKGNKAKSPKADKKGKTKTTWDPFMFGGKGATGEEARNLERGPKEGAHGGINDDHQMAQFVPDSSVIGASATIQQIEEDSSDDDEELLSRKANDTQSGGLWSSLSSLVGSKSLTEKDIEPVIVKMQDHLISKNVASDVAVKLCESVANNLEGKVLGTFSTIHRTVKESLNGSLMKLLTPKRRIDIIRDVMEAKANKRPYVMAFCGVNGVGKSTNLAKICFWLIENKCRVLIAACDTFRAGAVEQLRTHTRRLNNLHPASENGGVPLVELYEKGYGKDAAGIALEAINYARNNRIDVVLVDTAGRMQDNEPLMRALAKLIAVNAPDLVLFVGKLVVSVMLDEARRHGQD